MHPEIKNILNNLDPEYPFPAPAVLRNAERILNYMDDIYLERTGKFEHTPAESLYIMWSLEGLEFHIECLKNGRILYTFRKGVSGKAFGSVAINQFMLRLENYLLAGIY
jgi:hypothetical protein